MLNPFIKHISGCSSARVLYLTAWELNRVVVSWPSILFREAVAYRSTSAASACCTPQRRSSLYCWKTHKPVISQDTTSHFLFFLWLQTKHNKSYLFQSLTIIQEMFRRFFLLSALCESGLIHKGPHLLYVLQPVTMTCYHFTTCLRFLISIRIGSLASCEEGSCRSTCSSSDQRQLSTCALFSSKKMCSISDLQRNLRFHRTALDLSRHVYLGVILHYEEIQSWWDVIKMLRVVTLCYTFWDKLFYSSLWVKEEELSWWLWLSFNKSVLQSTHPPLDRHWATLHKQVGKLYQQLS